MPQGDGNHSHPSCGVRWPSVFTLSAIIVGWSEVVVVVGKEALLGLRMCDHRGF
jgi:hypothetical protein